MERLLGATRAPLAEREQPEQATRALGAAIRHQRSISGQRLKMKKALKRAL
jgi:hypothetical protein